MSSITQEKDYRESVIKYANKNGVPKACAKYHTSRSSIYRWRKKWLENNQDKSCLINGSRRPKTHPNAHTDEELAKIRNVRRRNPNMGLQDLWLRLVERHGYKRTIQGLNKALRRLNMPTNPQTKPSPTCKKSKPYEAMWKPGQRIQIDVKYVPRECLDPSYYDQYPFEQLFQYTALDEYSRYRILVAYREHNTYASALFLRQVYSAFKALGITIECVQTDNGSEFTSHLTTKDEKWKSSFELTAIALNIRPKYIRPHTPKHNGKVERSHREDQKLFYSEILRTKKLLLSFTDYKQRLKRHQDKTNNRPMRPLNYRTPAQTIKLYFLYKHIGNTILRL